MQSFDAVTINRAGRIAEAQHATLERRIRMLRWMYLGCCAVFVGLALMLTVGMLTEPGTEDVLPVILAADGVILLLTLPVIWRMRREIRKVREDMTEGRVVRFYGKLRLGPKANSLIVAGQHFPTPRDWRTLDWKAHYIVYVAPRSRVVVGMEKS